MSASGVCASSSLCPGRCWVGSAPASGSRRSRWDSTCRRWSSCSRSTFSSRSWSAHSTISPRASGSESEGPMRISPLDIRQQQFTERMFRGFDKHEADEFLDDVAGDYKTLLKENALLREQLATLEERSRGLAERERALQDTLVTTQRLGDEMKAAARREAELHMREAELRGEKGVEGARSEGAKIRSEVQSLRRVRRQLVEDLRSTLESYYRMMAADFGEDAGPPKG